MNEEPAMRWAREQIEEIFTNARLPYVPTHPAARPARAPLLACLLATTAFFLLLMAVTFVLAPSSRAHADRITSRAGSPRAAIH
jgi:hypothetical protein